MVCIIQPEQITYSSAQFASQHEGGVDGGRKTPLLDGNDALAGEPHSLPKLLLGQSALQSQVTDPIPDIPGVAGWHSGTSLFV